jgi:hypothetical protein
MEMEVGAKVIIYTVIMRGNAQTSFAGTVLAINPQGITVETPGGRTFFPWTAIERISY